MTYHPTAADVLLVDALASLAEHTDARRRAEHLGPKAKALAARMRAGIVAPGQEEEGT
jgi:hypothetical protein